MMRIDKLQSYIDTESLKKIILHDLTEQEFLLVTSIDGYSGFGYLIVLDRNGNATAVHEESHDIGGYVIGKIYLSPKNVAARFLLNKHGTIDNHKTDYSDIVFNYIYSDIVKNDRIFRNSVIELAKEEVEKSAGFSIPYNDETIKLMSEICKNRLKLKLSPH